MLQHTEQEWLDQIAWSTRRDSPSWRDTGDYVLALECWRYEHVSEAKENVNWRLQWLACEAANDGPRPDDLDDRVLTWLRFQEPLPPPENSGALHGGIRLILCDRPNMVPGITMSKMAFSAIHTTLDLHPTTLPAFFPHGGVYTSFVDRDPHTDEPKRIHIIVKAAQKVEIGNYLLSLSYDIQTGWTNAFICGDGVIKPRACDMVYGRQLDQLRAAITSNIQLWTNPLFLPFVILDNDSHRTQLRVSQTEAALIEVEKTLGVMNAGPVWQDAERANWPGDIDTKETTFKLHSVAPQIVFMKSNCKWLSRYAEFLKVLNSELAAEDILKRHGTTFRNLRGMIDLATSWINGMDSSFTILQERTKLQVDVLFNIISQQANVLNQQESRLNTSVARSAKKDSISMTTFTFITALFLPASFIASLLGMSMFDWTPEGGTHSNEVVSNRFWLFWVIAIPLTLATLGGWFLWFGHANKKFSREMERIQLDISTDQTPAPKQSHFGWVRGSYSAAGVRDVLPMKPEHNSISERRSQAHV